MLPDNNCLRPQSAVSLPLCLIEMRMAFLRALLSTSKIVVLAAAACAFARSEVQAQDPNSACASCHRSIYERYRHTPMANGSGLALDGFAPADFTHQASGIHYRIYAEAGKVYLSYERRAGSAGGALEGHQTLAYFLGSGKRGRTFL